MEEKKSILEWFGLIISAIGFIVIVVAFFILFNNNGLAFSEKIGEEKVGQFGDFIGGFVGSLFALAGVFLYFVALKEQRKDIKLNREALSQQIEEFQAQKEELHAQKEEMQETRRVYEEQTILFREQTESYKKQAEEANKQTKIANLDQFNSSFYSFLNLFRESKEMINFDEDSKKIVDLPKQSSLSNDLQNLAFGYDSLYALNRVAYQNYLKNINIMLNIIDSANIDGDKRMHYADIFRSQLSSKELLLLYSCVLSDKDRVNRALFDKYDLLKDMNGIDKIHLTNNADLADLLKPYMNRVCESILEVLRKYADIENDDDDDRYSFDSNIRNARANHMISIENDEFRYVVQMSKAFFQDQQDFDEESFEDFHYRMLNYVFFCSKFKMIKENVWRKSVSAQEDLIKFVFLADIKEIA